MLDELIPVRPWTAKALCAGRTNQWVFDTDRITRAPEQRAIAAAVAVCRQCPVEIDCRFDAVLSPNAMAGAVAGGLTPSELHKLRNQPVYITARKFLNRPPCGTPLAYNRHLEFNEDCLECRETNTRRNNPENNPRGHP